MKNDFWAEECVDDINRQERVVEVNSYGY